MVIEFETQILINHGWIRFACNWLRGMRSLIATCHGD